MQILVQAQISTWLIVYAKIPPTASACGRDLILNSAVMIKLI